MAAAREEMAGETETDRVTAAMVALLEKKLVATMDWIGMSRTNLSSLFDASYSMTTLI